MGFGGEMEGCGKFMKYSMFLSNFLILIGGIIILAIGIWTKVDKQYLEELLGSNLYVSAAYILIVVGIIVILISFLGCMGAVKEIKCMLLTYFIVIFIVFVLLLIGGILGYVFKDKVKETMRNEMLQSVKSYYRNGGVRSIWDQTHQTLQCCGVNSFDDWLRELGPGRIPSSCCRDQRDASCLQRPLPPRIFDEGCLNKASDSIKTNANIIGGVGIGVACLMILGMIFSCALFKLIE